MMYRKDRKDEFYTRKAHQEGYPARSVYKLKEIDEKFNLVKKGDFVLDLGCSPGSWLMYLSAKVGDKGRVVGVDIIEPTIPERENIFFIKKDVMVLEIKELEVFCQKYQVVVSDLAPATSGIRLVDTGRSLILSQKALEIASMVLAEGGNFLCKIFEGKGSHEFFKEVSQSFKTAKIFRPPAVFKGSREFYVVAKGFMVNPVRNF